jgi:hypothetical protein
LLSKQNSYFDLSKNSNLFYNINLFMEPLNTSRSSISFVCKLVEIFGKHSKTHRALYKILGFSLNFRCKFFLVIFT